jgi:hypothetical protein
MALGWSLLIYGIQHSEHGVWCVCIEKTDS